jgi:hypothetical protein
VNTLTTTAAVALVLTLGCSSGARRPGGGSGGTAGAPDQPDAGCGACAGRGGAAGPDSATESTPDSAGVADTRVIDAPAAPDAAADAPRADASPATSRDSAAAAEAGAPGQALHNYVFSVECPTPGTGGECNVPDARRLKTSAPLSFGGDPATTYKVRLHFCGPVEGRKYAGCARGPYMNDSLLCVDGTPVPMGGGDNYVDTYPTYELKVSAPAHSYFVNSRDLRDTLMKIDYSADLEIRGGATLTFSTTSREQVTFTSRKIAPPVTCPAVPGLTQPFNGQFVHVTVMAVDPL